MKKLNRKGAIELSMNFIVVIVISSIILVGGLTLFYKMTRTAQETVTTLDSQTEKNIESMMLNNNYRTAVYPQDTTLNMGDSKLFGVGITNIYDYESTFVVSLTAVEYHASATDPAHQKTVGSDYYDISNGGKITIGPHAQGVKEILLKLSKSDTNKGQYVYTIKVYNGTTSTDSKATYGTLQVYVTN